MSQKYDNKTLSFCPEGRLRQVENALESIRNSNSIIGIKTKSGLILASDKTIKSGLNQNSRYSERIFLIDTHIMCAITGAGPDAQILINYARLESQLYKQVYQDLIPIKKLVDILCDIKQKFTQSGGKRPFGASFIIAGWDNFSGYQLFRTDPSGNYSGWKAVAIGFNSVLNQNTLNEQITDFINLFKGIAIVIKIFSKKLANISLSQTIDLVILKKDDFHNIIYHRFNPKEMDSIYKKM